MVLVQIKVPNWLDWIFSWPVVVYRKIKYGYSFRRIDLGEGESAILDQKDYYRFGGVKWHINKSSKHFYAARTAKIGPMKTRILGLHREIMGAPKGLLVDHRNRVTLDDRQENLRLATHCENSYNRKNDKSKTTSKYVGVSYNKHGKFWCARIRYEGKRLWLGTFKNESEAARVYDAAARKYHGEFAQLNFPEEASNAAQTRSE